MVKNIDIKEIINIAKDASVEVMKIYEKDFTVEYKDDKSPLTEADLKANEIICNSLKKLYPNIPILSEETKLDSYENRKNWEYLWLIDPIDGTKEFVKKNGEFTINIALIHSGVPVLGVVYAPAIDVLYYAKKDEGAYVVKKGTLTKLPIKRDDNKFYIVASKSHLSDETKEYIENIETNKEKVLTSIGSSLKLCMVAEGVADIYPRHAPTSEWDTGAAHAVVLEAGKDVVDAYENSSLIYNKESVLNPFFIVK